MEEIEEEYTKNGKSRVRDKLQAARDEKYFIFIIYMLIIIIKF